MKRTEKYWTINFREEDHDGLVRCYRRNGTEGFRLLWENVADCKFAAEQIFASRQSDLMRIVEAERKLAA